jgi:hypothetical protein
VPLRSMFSTEIFMARGHAYLWTPWLLVGEIASNALIAVALVAIAIRLFRRGRAPETGPRGRTTLWLGILAAGLATIHILDVWVTWNPIYGIDVVVRGLVALVSLAAATWL